MKHFHKNKFLYIFSLMFQKNQMNHFPFWKQKIILLKMNHQNKMFIFILIFKLKSISKFSCLVHVETCRLFFPLWQVVKNKLYRLKKNKISLNFKLLLLSYGIYCWSAFTFYSSMTKLNFFVLLVPLMVQKEKAPPPQSIYKKKKESMLKPLGHFTYKH